MNNQNIENKRIIITGCGYKPVENIFYNMTDKKPSHNPIYINDMEMKMNIGTAIAKCLAENGATVHMVGHSEEKIRNIYSSLSQTIKSRRLEYSIADLLNESDIERLVSGLPRDKDIYWIQSVGLGAGSYRLKDDNPYLPLEQIPIELIEEESRTVLRSTHLMMKNLLPILEKQKESRITIISSMSAIRGYSLGGTHCAAKGAIDRYANSAMLSLYKKNIFVTTIRPGAVDTGMYDSERVQDSIKFISDEYQGAWNRMITLAPPSSIGEAALYALTTPAHITSMNIVAQGQFPNEGS